MLNKIKNYIDNNHLLVDGAKVILAFSYGIDSRVLLDVLLKLKFNVVLCHVNHQKRQMSAVEEKSALELAKKYGIKCYVYHLDTENKENFHSQAHNKRYQFFMDIANAEHTKYIVTAHHLDDNAETILLNLIKGSNLYGYSGISNHLTLDGFEIVRPLMCVTKDMIKAYQKENELDYFEDESNGEDHYTRNRIRHHVIPLLKKENPNLLFGLANYSTYLKDAFNYIRKQSIEFLNKTNNIIDIRSFNILDKALRHDILSLLLEKYQIERSYNLIMSLDSLLMGSSSQGDISLEGDYIFKKRYNEAFIDKAHNFEPISYELYENSVIYTKNMRFYFTKILPSNNANYIKLCYNELVYPLILRTRQAGDRIRMPYGTKKVKDLLIDLKLSKEQRDDLLVLENNHQIIWICGYAKSEALCKMKDKGDIYLVYEVQNEQ